MHDMNKIFDFKTAQKRWYEKWEASHLFEGKPSSNKIPWSIVIPPPNITGNLHMGHALVFTLHDVIARFKRAQGFDAVWIPGVDHAGIATQIIVERQLKDSEGKTRHDIGRDAFVQLLWDWKNKNQDLIENQLKSLGASVDWTRKRFTMDSDLNRAVRKVFVDAYRQGRIFKGSRMIQWDPDSQTALSDLEVKYVERHGKLWYIRYPFVDGSGYLVVATTRPETMLGDTGVAVHPDDKRFSGAVGKLLRLPLTNRVIPVVADSFVDPKFPAHDVNDNAAGKRLGLANITVIGFDAKMTQEAGPDYVGLDRFECRKIVLKKLEEQDFIDKIEPYVHQVSISERSGAVLEPLVSEQWFMKMDDIAKQALEAVRSGRIKFTPKRWEGVWEHWLNNIQDWCISRQLWWGHRIPVWTCNNCNHFNVAEEVPSHCEKCHGVQLTQDPDTLDTWFSSALWPFSSFGWPERTIDLERYYPTNLLITGYDILFFWVARMVMAGLSLTDDVPFRDVYFNALVRDEHGAKMSKSKGNVIDPLESMDNYGTDALRYSLIVMAAPGTDISLSRSRLEASRNFCNKLWNAARFVQTNLPPSVTLEMDPIFGEAEYWMIGRLRLHIGVATKSIEEFRFHEAAETLYHLVWDDFCATYIELAKTNLVQGSLQQKAAILHFLDIILRALHPIMPFVTEEIHEAVMIGRLPAGESELLAGRSWPANDPLLCIDGGNQELIPCFQETLSAIHRLKRENSIDPGKRVAAFCTVAILEPFAESLKNIAKLESITFIHGELPSASRALAVVTGGTVALELAGIKDLSGERKRLEDELNKLVKELRSLELRLSDSAFIEKAPEVAISKVRESASMKRSRLAQIEELLK